MPRGVSLADCVTDVRQELLDSANVNVGKTLDGSIKRKLERVQRDVYLDNDWPIFKHYGDKTLSAGSRYYDLPSTLDPESVVEVRYKWSGIWSEPLEQGITLDDYNAQNSDANIRADPVLKWDYYNTGSIQVEVWPIPATNGGTLRFKGKRPLARFTNDTDTCTLDSDLIVLLAAAEILDARGRREAAQLFAKADKRFRKITGRAGANRSLNLNGGMRRRIRPLHRIHVTASS
jgi:hypothetical protein